jgi:hypothetical protein
MTAESERSKTPDALALDAASKSSECDRLECAEDEENSAVKKLQDNEPSDLTE